MHEGLEDDDKYIMVEDEFHAVANTFTQHLHHAEYVRLKQLAKSQNASKIHTISRPVDPRTEMREDTKIMRAQETKSRLQENALRDMLLAKGNEDESDLDDQAKTHKDPWVGTSLQGLMASPKRAERSLTAVSGIRSSTRAAAGFTKAANVAAPISKPTCPAKREPTPESAPGRFLLRDEATASEDDGGGDDDLDAPLYTKAEDNAYHRTNPGMYKGVSGDGRREDIQIKHGFSRERKTGNSDGNGLEGRPYASYSSGSSKASYDFFPKPTTLSCEASQLLGKRIAKSKAETADADVKNGKASSIFNEIPTFLV